MTENVNKKYRLSIQLSLGGFSFLVINTETSEVLQEKRFVMQDEEESFSAWLKVKLASEPLLREKYESTVLMYVPHKYTIVPEVFYQKENARQMFTSVQSLEKTEMLCEDFLADAVVLYSVQEDVFLIFKEFLPKLSWLSLPAYGLRSVMKEEGWRVSVYVLEKEIFLSISNGEKLKLSNRFYCANTTDRVYYIFYCIENMNIPIGDSVILLDGHGELLVELEKALSEYHKGVVLLDEKNGANTKTPFGKILARLMS